MQFATQREFQTQNVFQVTESVLGVTSPSDLKMSVPYFGDHARFVGFAVTLTGTGCKTQGVVLVNKLRMMNLGVRKARRVERAPKEVVEDALARIAALLE